MSFDYGFDAAHVVVAELPSHALIGLGLTDVVKWSALNKQQSFEAVESLSRLPGISTVAAVSVSPIPKRRQAEAEVESTVGIPTFFNEALARRISPMSWPLGQRIKASWFTGTVIGVVKDLVDSAPGVPPRPQIFEPLVRRSAIRADIESRLGPMRSSQIRLLVEDVDATVAPWKGRSALLALVALLCVPIAVVGLSGGLLFAVRVQTRDIGIRLALGASPAQARKQVIDTGLMLSAIGGAAGMLIGVLAGRLMGHQLFEVRHLPHALLASIPQSFSETRDTCAGFFWTCGFQLGADPSCRLDCERRDTREFEKRLGRG